MKNIILFINIIIVFATMQSCHHKMVAQKSFNIESVDTHGNPMLLGQCTRKRLEASPYGEWFNKNYSDYKVDSNTTDKLKQNFQGKKFKIFMGTWCGDSKREVPRMFHILDYCGVKPGDITLIMLNSYDSVYKQSPNHEERGLNIHRVPDLLVYDGDKELGRIVESPVVSLEYDLVDICNGKYTPNYHIVP